jgi:DNA polymerase III alpha subunit
VTEWLWVTNEKSADYSFNRSHAACYALIAYRTAWLRANYPAEYMAALISSVMSTKDKVPFFAARCEEMGIAILPPDVNLSDHEFVVVDGNIRFGLDAVKGVGYSAVEAIKAAREEGGPFESIWDFCARVDPQRVNKKAIEALVKCGAFGSTGATRKGMLAVLEQAQAAGQKVQLDAQIGQGSRNLLLATDPAVFTEMQQTLSGWRAERDRLASELANLERSRVDVAAEVKRLEGHLWRLREALADGDPSAVQGVIRELVERVELRFTHHPCGKRVRSRLDGGTVVVREVSAMGPSTT